MFNHIRMVVLATNAEGSPDFFLTFADVTDTQYMHGLHYDMALARAEDEGYERPMIAFDPNDAAARRLHEVVAYLDVKHT
ncbi:hypothetical protein CY652_09960 [Burkholderia sp. WAC0059]|uniref:hypothetical protein n=1 Tax=Burkholderia sp. WAC0059 TaxID=2066022 RepID=UPI000C7EDB5A|nr:hypothetical protein [Burkholderia sp. WAC0059]PLZ02443.1 hypothetical protein CY652_09960 [Burkholderia sp. WAC0059]